MRKTLLIGLICLSAIELFAQKKKVEPEKKEIEYQFTVVKELPHTSVKNQANSSTCWSFSGISMFESEIMRIKGDTIDLSPMWVVRNSYIEKVEKYVRMHGDISVAPGGSFYDVLHALEVYGIVPQVFYPGLNYGTDNHNHPELDNIITAFAQSVVQQKKLSTAWRSALLGILDAYLGKAPATFTYKNVEYTPQTFVKATGINFDDYVSITSFSHHPFYKQFILEIPDNWAYATSWNLPLNEFASIFEYAINAGYTIAWAADVSEKSFTRDIATFPDEKKGTIVGSDEAKWTKQKGKEETIVLETEKEVTQEMRQQWFDNYETTDDHGMHIVGIVKDQFGRKYYKVKNSWGDGGKYKGYLYVTEPFVLAKTTNIMINKNGVPSEIRKKLGF